MSMNIERAGQHMRCEAFVPGGMMGKGGEELHGDGKADVGSPEQSAAPDVVGNVGGQQGNGNIPEAFMVCQNISDDGNGSQPAFKISPGKLKLAGNGTLILIVFQIGKELGPASHGKLFDKNPAWGQGLGAISGEIGST